MSTPTPRTPPDGGVEGPVVAVMQPYLLPYIGTFQLAHAVDHFVFFDDVAFIKKGYIHRNSLLLGGAPHLFTVPVRQVSQNRPINAHDYTGEWDGLIALLTQAYRKAPHFEAVMAWLLPLLRDADENVARKNARVFAAVARHIGIAARWHKASDLPPREDGLRAQSRIIDLCQQLGGHGYVNAAGGRALYQGEAFEAAGLRLRFLDSRATPYPQQGSAAFTPHLSIVDWLMNLAPDEIAARLPAYTLQA